MRDYVRIKLHSRDRIVQIPKRTLEKADNASNVITPPPLPAPSPGLVHCLSVALFYTPDQQWEVLHNNYIINLLHSFGYQFNSTVNAKMNKDNGTIVVREMREPFKSATSGFHSNTNNVT